MWDNKNVLDFIDLLIFNVKGNYSNLLSEIIVISTGCALGITFL